LILAEWLQYPVKRKALPEFQQLFPDDAACAAYLEKARWDEQSLEIDSREDQARQAEATLMASMDAANVQR
jgi:hypothetical protein